MATKTHLLDRSSAPGPPVVLPEQAQSRPAPTDVLLLAPADPTRMHVLVGLERHGVSVEACALARDAEAAILGRATPFEVALIDPGSEGIDLLHRLQEVSRGTLRILIASKDRRDDIRDGYRAGAHSLFMAIDDPEALAEYLHRLGPEAAQRRREAEEPRAVGWRSRWEALATERRFLVKFGIVALVLLGILIACLVSTARMIRAREGDLDETMRRRQELKLKGMEPMTPVAPPPGEGP